MYSNQWTKIALLVREREVVSWEATVREVLDRADVLSVGRVLALARYPHHV